MLCTLLPVAGCDLFERTTVEDSAAVKFSGNDEDFEFWDSLSTQPVVTNNDALHGLLLLIDGKDDCETYECRYQAGVDKGWFDGNWGDMPPADESARIGWMAVAGCQILKIKGGLTMQLFGDSPRYCSRELTFMGILPSVTENEALSGLEFTAYVDNIEDRQRFDAAAAARKQLDEQKKASRWQAESKRISEVLTPMDANPVAGPEPSPKDTASPEGDEPSSSTDTDAGTNQ
jgi:hypothetical protein